MTFQLAAHADNATCQLSTRVDLETLKIASGFKKWWMIGSILDIEGRKFEELAIRFTPSDPLPYHLNPINTSQFMEEGDGKFEI